MHTLALAQSETNEAATCRTVGWADDFWRLATWGARPFGGCAARTFETPMPPPHFFWDAVFLKTCSLSAWVKVHPGFVKTNWLTVSQIFRFQVKHILSIYQVPFASAPTHWSGIPMAPRCAESCPNCFSAVGRRVRSGCPWTWMAMRSETADRDQGELVYFQNNNDNDVFLFLRILVVVCQVLMEWDDWKS